MVRAKVDGGGARPHHFHRLRHWQRKIAGRQDTGLSRFMQG